MYRTNIITGSVYAWISKSETWWNISCWLGWEGLVSLNWKYRKTSCGKFRNSCKSATLVSVIYINREGHLCCRKLRFVRLPDERQTGAAEVLLLCFRESYSTVYTAVWKDFKTHISIQVKFRNVGSWCLWVLVRHTQWCSKSKRWTVPSECTTITQ